MPVRPKKLHRKLTQQEFYCVECRKRVRVPKEDIKVRKDKRGRPRMQAKHGKEGHKVFKYIKFDHEKKLKQKFN